MNNALLDWVAEITARDRSGGIAKGVGTVGGGLVELAEIFLLERQPVHKGLAAIIQRAVSGTVRAGEGVDLDHPASGFVEMLKALIPDFMVVDRILAKSA